MQCLHDPIEPDEEHRRHDAAPGTTDRAGQGQAGHKAHEA